MEYYTANNQRLIFTQADFKGSGGEGSVYVQGGHAYKIYTDPANVIPTAKLDELSVLDRPEILRPKHHVLDGNRVPVGYVMDAVSDALPLGRTFTKTFRDKNQLTPDIVVNLVLALRRGVQYIHGKGITIVDLNENNFLVDSAFHTIYFIDVDSYQTPSFAATVLSESVRDRHACVFSDLSDWFSFAVVSFQLFTGIHPYRGAHPGYKSLDERMKANVSVFNPRVKLPSACLPFDVIPNAYRDWYEAVFERGYRAAPPETAQSIVVLRASAVANPGHSRFVIDLLQDFPADILDYLNGAVVTLDGVTLGTSVWPQQDVVLGCVLHNNTPIAARVDRGRLRLFDLMRGHEIAADIACEAVIGSEGRIYVKRGGMLLEVCFVGMPAGTLVSTRQASAVPEQATHLFPGVAFLDLLGSWYASLLAAKGSAPQVRLKDLDGYRLIDARYQKRVLMVVAVKDGSIDKFIYRFNDQFSSHDVRIVHDISVPGVNFAVLDTGVCLHMTHDDQLEVFSNSPSDKMVNVFSDPELNGGCTLYKNGSQGLFARGSGLYRFSMAVT